VTGRCHSMRALWTISMVLLIVFISPCVFAEDEPEEERDYRYGSIRLGAFWVGQIDSSMVARSEDSPVGIFIDLSRDLALGDSVTVPRGIFTYRFSRRHQVGFNVFRISRDNTVVLERTIEIGDSEFPIGAEVDVSSNVTVYKAGYTWLFYDSDKVVLGASVGLNIVDFNLGLNATYGAEPVGGGAVEERAGVTAPIPVIGLRIVYRATRKFTLVAVADIMAVEIGKYGGTYQDNYVLLDWRLSKVFSIGCGLNSLDLELELEEDILASARHRYRGVIGFVGFHF
jgi:hypothetical protein